MAGGWKMKPGVAPKVYLPPGSNLWEDKGAFSMVCLEVENGESQAPDTRAWELRVNAY